MSENWIFLLPTEPSYVPVAAAQERARRFYARFVPEAEEVNAVTTPGGAVHRSGCELKCHLLSALWKACVTIRRRTSHTAACPARLSGVQKRTVLAAILSAPRLD